MIISADDPKIGGQPRTRVALWMSEGVLRDTLECRMATEPQLETRGYVDNPERLESVVEYRPDVVLIEVRPNDNEIIDCAIQLTARVPGVAVLFVMAKAFPYLISQALTIGIHGCLSESDCLEEWLNGIRAAADDATNTNGANGRHNGAVHWIGSTSILRVLQFDADANQYVLADSHSLQRLTPRQIEVLRLVSLGRSMREISNEMQLSAKSVETHKYRLSQRLGISDRVQLTRLAIRFGLVSAE